MQEIASVCDNRRQTNEHIKTGADLKFHDRTEGVEHIYATKPIKLKKMDFQ